MMWKLAAFGLCLTALVTVSSVTTDAQRRGGAPPGAGGPGRGGRGSPGTVERVTVHGRALEGNLAGDSADRAVAVYLPPSYAVDQNRRYATLYLLHGPEGNENTFVETSGLRQSADRLSGAQGFSEFIVVTPNALTKDAAAMYGNSPRTGDWERYVAEDLVAYIDSHYRTLAQRMSRGVAGHSTGGSAALRIGMKYPEVFANLYAMSPCCGEALTALVPQYASNLTLYYSIAMEIGATDPLLAENRQLHAAMSKLRIPHTFEEYDADGNRLAERIERNLLPFFARHLAAPSNLTSPAPAADRLSKSAR